VRRHALLLTRISLDLAIASDLCRCYRASILTALNPRAYAYGNEMPVKLPASGTFQKSSIPRQTPRQWAERLVRRNIRLETQDIRAVMEHYHLTVKKGLLNS